MTVFHLVLPINAILVSLLGKKEKIQNYDAFHTQTSICKHLYSNNHWKSYNQCHARCEFSLCDTQFSFIFVFIWNASNHLLFIELMGGWVCWAFSILHIFFCSRLFNHCEMFTFWNSICFQALCTTDLFSIYYYTKLLRLNLISLW